MSKPIVPENMYTDGCSVPRVFWSIPGLSPWGLGPAYIIHDWIFEVHRSLIEAGLIQHNMLPEIVWGTARDGSPLTFAGLWEEWKEIETGEFLKSCTIIITSA